MTKNARGATKVASPVAIIKEDEDKTAGAKNIRSGVFPSPSPLIKMDPPDFAG